MRHWRTCDIPYIYKLNIPQACDHLEDMKTSSRASLFILCIQMYHETIIFFSILFHYPLDGIIMMGKIDIKITLRFFEIFKDFLRFF